MTERGRTKARLENSGDTTLNSTMHDEIEELMDDYDLDEETAEILRTCHE